MDKSDVLKLAHLARLEIDGAEAEAFAQELDAFLIHAQCLKAVDVQVADAELVASAGKDPTPLRSDTPRENWTVDEALANAPAAEAGYFLVPRIMD